MVEAVRLGQGPQGHRQPIGRQGGVARQGDRSRDGPTRHELHVDVRIVLILDQGLGIVGITFCRRGTVVAIADIGIVRLPVADYESGRCAAGVTGHQGVVHRGLAGRQDDQLFAPEETVAVVPRRVGRQFVQLDRDVRCCRPFPGRQADGAIDGRGLDKGHIQTRQGTVQREGRFRLARIREDRVLCCGQVTGVEVGSLRRPHEVLKIEVGLLRRQQEGKCHLVRPLRHPEGGVRQVERGGWVIRIEIDTAILAERPLGQSQGAADPCALENSQIDVAVFRAACEQGAEFLLPLGAAAAVIAPVVIVGVVIQGILHLPGGVRVGRNAKRVVDAFLALCDGHGSATVAVAIRAHILC